MLFDDDVNDDNNATLDAAAHVPPIDADGDKYIFIIGHVGAPKQETYIGWSTDPGEAIRQYNNSLRGERPGIVCVCIYVPGWRRLAVRTLVQLWHRSRKLYCRMRFGISMAYDLRLPCFVSPLALRGEEARKSMPHIVARLITDAFALAHFSDTVEELRRLVLRKRTRRASPHDSAVAEHVVFGDLSTDNIAATIGRSNERLAAFERPLLLTDDRLHALNTLVYQHKSICFSDGQPIRLAKRAASAKRRASTSARAGELDDSDAEEEGDSAVMTPQYTSDGDDDEAQNDEDDASIVSPNKKPRKAARKRVTISEQAHSLTPLRQRNKAELEKYRTSSQGPASPSSASSAPSRAGEVAARECTVGGVLDNRLLAEKAEFCFTDGNEYIDRARTAVRLDRAQHCVCGARGSFARNGVCRECQRSMSAVRVMRTNTVALREQATKQKCTPHDRRELRRLLISSERDTPIDVYSQNTTSQLEEIVAQQEQQHQQHGSRASTRARIPKEMNIISAMLSRLTAVVK